MSRPTNGPYALGTTGEPPARVGRVLRPYQQIYRDVVAKKRPWLALTGRFEYFTLNVSASGEISSYHVLAEVSSTDRTLIRDIHKAFSDVRPVFPEIETHVRYAVPGHQYFPFSASPYMWLLDDNIVEGTWVRSWDFGHWTRPKLSDRVELLLRRHRVHRWLIGEHLWPNKALMPTLYLDNASDYIMAKLLLP